MLDAAVDDVGAGHPADDRGTCLYHPGQDRPGPAQVEATGKALGDSRRSGRSYHPDLGGPDPTWCCEHAGIEVAPVGGL